MPSSPTGACERLAADLTDGLRRELRLTPKPGLVDLADQGSHPDLTLALMERSIALVGGAFEALAASLARREPLARQVALGQAAEQELHRTFGTNTHKGALFLGGLLLVARSRVPEGMVTHSRVPGEVMLPSRAPDDRVARPSVLDGVASRSRPQDVEVPLRAAVAAAARELLADRPLPESHGAAARRRFGVGGVVAEALAGLPSVFEVALPAWRAAAAGDRRGDEAAFGAMAALMQTVEDTTALHRGGEAGLARLRRDGRELERRLGAGEDHLAFLADANAAWRDIGLTMGGVADLLGVSLGLLRHLGDIEAA